MYPYKQALKSMTHNYMCKCLMSLQPMTIMAQVEVLVLGSIHYKYFTHYASCYLVILYDTSTGRDRLVVLVLYKRLERLSVGERHAFGQVLFAETRSQGQQLIFLRADVTLVYCPDSGFPKSQYKESWCLSLSLRRLLVLLLLPFLHFSLLTRSHINNNKRTGIITRSVP